MNFTYFSRIILKGGVIAYPTEAIFGIGCNPFDENAVKRLLDIKKRPVSRGLILVAANWQSIAGLTMPLPQSILDRALQTWPGPHTWLFPASDLTPAWIRGEHQTVALRLSNHPTLIKLCQALGGPLVSTSANHHQQTPAVTHEVVKQYFGNQLDAIIPGQTQGHTKPSSITDIISNKIIR